MAGAVRLGQLDARSGADVGIAVAVKATDTRSSWAWASCLRLNPQRSRRRLVAAFLD